MSIKFRYFFKLSVLSYIHFLQSRKHITDSADKLGICGLFGKSALRESCEGAVFENV